MLPFLPAFALSGTGRAGRRHENDACAPLLNRGPLVAASPRNRTCVAARSQTFTVNLRSLSPKSAFVRTVKPRAPPRTGTATPVL